MSDKTNKQYSRQVDKARNVFISKNKDYGTSWRILRLTSLIDQIYIKADRIRNIEESKVQKIEDDIYSEYIGIINYSALALIQIEIGKEAPLKMELEPVIELYDKYIQNARSLMNKKNHDYGEAWRNMYISSYTDLILSKILRMKQILENEGKTSVSEGIDANLYDIMNYSFFALIKLEEENERT